MRIALYQPEIPQNTGTILRMGACLGVGVDIIEPCGFVWRDQKLRRAGMDYLDLATVKRHTAWDTFCQEKQQGRVVLLDIAGASPYQDFTFHPDDTLLLGRESDGVPDSVKVAVEASVYIPMVPGRRSLNVAVSLAMVLGEALRQTGGYNFDNDARAKKASL